MSRPAEAPSRRHWRVAIVLLGVLVLVGVVVFLSVPQSGGAQGTTFTVLRVPARSTSAVEVEITVDSINATAGSMRARLSATTTHATPPQGVTVFTSIPGASSITVKSDQLVKEKSASLSFTSGDIGDYPFEDFRGHIEMVVGQGTAASLDSKQFKALPFEIVGNSTLAGMTVSGQTSVDPGQVAVTRLQIRRSSATKGWAFAMMAIYWAIALLVAGVTYEVVTRRRSWALLLLSWLSATVFALISFRATAPGSPPVGTFFDFFAFFESVGIVAICLVALLIYYLVERKSRLEP